MRRFGWYLVLGLLAAVSVVALSQAQRIREFATRLGSGWSNLHPELRSRIASAIERANAKLAELGDSRRLAPFEGWRTIERQREIIGQANGATAVENPLDSYHVWGLAVDCVFLDRLGRWEWPPVDDPVWKIYGDAVRGVGLIWGRDWDNDGKYGEKGEFDAPHAQLRPDGYKVKQLRELYADVPDKYLATFG